VPDLRFLLDHMLAGAVDEILDRIDLRRIGLIGWSFGGWAALSTLEVDDRFRAMVALAPAGNSKPLPGIIPATLTFAWKREVPRSFSWQRAIASRLSQGNTNCSNAPRRASG
jgi:pimeloyl-ACP methyl ester carboxylesterase